MTRPTPLPASVLLAYGGPYCALAALLFFVQFYFLKFTTDVLLLPPALVGGLFAAAKLWDAVCNPLVGSWSDHTTSRFGRRRPFLFGSLPLLAAAFVTLWSIPDGLSRAVLTASIGAALFLFFSAFALYAVPHAALGAELSADSHQRTRLFAGKQMSFTLGMLLAFGAIQVAMNAASPRHATATMVWPAAIVAALVLAITPLMIREPRRAPTPGRSLARGLRQVLANHPARLLLLVWFIESLGVGAVGTMAPYIAQYILRRPDIVGSLPAAYVVSGIVSIPLWVRVSRRLGGRDTWLAAMLLAAGAFGATVLIGAGDVWLAIGLLILAGTAMGCGSVLSASLMADIIDLDAQHSGHRQEGIYSAAMLLALKMGNSLATAASGLVLGVVGFLPNGEQSADSLFGMRLLFGGMPCAGFLVGALLFRNFPLGRRLPGATGADLRKVA
jgi:GPH family glycoside/pentoside/hexuronide:cation symporter